MGSTPSCSDDEFIYYFEHCESIEAAAKKIGCKVRAVMARRQRIENKLGIKIKPFSETKEQHIWPEYNHLRFNLKSPFDIMVVSDRHCMPGEIPAAFKVACSVATDLQPKILIVNGDWYDLPNMSRHVQHCWENRPASSPVAWYGYGWSAGAGPPVRNCTRGSCCCSAWSR